MDYLIRKKAPDLKYEILGTDIDLESVKIAQNGVYRRDEIKEVPLTYLKDHWIKGTGDIANFVKVKASLKGNTKFQVFNLVKASDFLKVGKYDLIFCRNVFIYFTQEQVKSISENLMTKLSPNGLFLIGTSESLNGMNLKVQSKGPAIYAHAGINPSPGTGPVLPFPTGVQRSTLSTAQTTTAPTTSASTAPSTSAPQILKVLCVDDSPSILTLLKVVFTKEAGFEIVGTAVNGKDAEKKVKELSPDLMTLDIHMPEMTGIEYLEKNYGPGHCPVVMITSVSRENSELAVKALELGASDYVEKPALNQLKERTDEIRMKLKTSFLNRGLEKATLGLEKSFLSSGVIQKPAEKVRIVYGTLSDRARIGASLKELTENDPPTVILIEKSAQNLDANSAVFSHAAGRKVEAATDPKGIFNPGKIYIGDFETLLLGLKSRFSPNGVSYLVYGVPTLKACTEISGAVQSQLLIEEQNSTVRHPLSARASDQFPSTSFIAISKEWFTK